ncbi:MAG: response regulator transcription factor [Candidatus Melainabacteria bacterium]|nr:response regulator transcription factor [Candidatus Melainabacteria bacterium]
MRILLADDHAMFRSGLRRIIEYDFPGACIEEASSCLQVLDKVKGGVFDLLILDIAMGDENSLDVLPEVKQLQKSAPVLILSMYGDRQFVVKALRAGASGYLTKEHTPEELAQGIRAVLSGRRYVSESIAANLADYLAVGDTERPHESLSRREQEVFLKIARGKSVSDIAVELSVSVKTVSTYRTRILEKMSLNSNAELMRYALKHKLVD